MKIAKNIMKIWNLHCPAHATASFLYAKAHFKKMQKEAKLSLNAMKVLEARYLNKDKTGKITETPAQLFRRVAKAVAQPDKKYRQNPKKAEEEFFEIMSSLEFMPNSPTLMNAGTDKQMLSACFVMPIEDSLESIFTTLKNMATVEQVGGGVGFNFSNLRPEGDIVGSTKGAASGPISFMRIYDMATEVIKQGSRRRGAMMGILNVSHPDIVKFIAAKQKYGMLKNFNVSAAVTDDFMKKAVKQEEFWLLHPATKKRMRKVNAADLLELIATNAWKTGDPGLVFIDEINRKNPTPKAGRIESTNPCAEIPLLPYESCNLGSINLSRLVKNGNVDWDRLKRLVHTGVHFLDNVIDANKFPIEETAEITRENRKIGLGVMGLAEMFIQLGMKYDSEEAVKFAESLMAFIRKEADTASAGLARKRGSFPNFKKSVLSKKFRAFRNATVTAIAPTGTISIIAGTSSGIEPLFAVSFVREVLGGQKLMEVNPVFEKIAKERGFYSKELMEKIAKTGKASDADIPEDVKRLFVTALEISPVWHVKMQAVFQKHVDNAVSKTVNLPESASIADVKKVYLLAYELKCKGITIYRYGSKPGQVLYIGENVKAHAEYSGGCATGECSF